MTTPRILSLAIAAAMIVAACGDDESSDDATATTEPTATEATTGDSATTTSESTPATTAGTDASDSTAAPAGSVTLVTYDSFPAADTSLNDALAAFTEQSGIEVEILVGGDTGTMVSKAALTAGNPEGDVMWGVDNTFLSRALEAEIFEPYQTSVALPDELTSIAPGGEVTPVDFGDVCINYDIGWFTENGIEPPTSLDDLTDAAYADLLVVQNPATSSPGFAFFLATVDEYGDDGWSEYWQALTDNGVAVVDSWTDAYYSDFTWAGGGDRPIVVSYGSSPPAEVLFADPPVDTAPTGVIESTCFRQVEFVGVLAGTDVPDEARALVDFLVSDAFQAELALNLFVYPASPTVELPQEFVDYAVVADDPRTVDPSSIESNREAWIDEWTALVLG
ncbi:MAG: thiamine ABC transporter substrate-binding protein [Actinomycetota bacterium]